MSNNRSLPVVLTLTTVSASILIYKAFKGGSGTKKNDDGRESTITSLLEEEEPNNVNNNNVTNSEEGTTDDTTAVITEETTQEEDAITANDDGVDSIAKNSSSQVMEIIVQPAAAAETEQAAAIIEAAENESVTHANRENITSIVMNKDEGIKPPQLVDNDDGDGVVPPSEETYDGSASTNEAIIPNESQEENIVTTEELNKIEVPVATVANVSTTTSTASIDITSPSIINPTNAPSTPTSRTFKKVSTPKQTTNTATTKPPDEGADYNQLKNFWKSQEEQCGYKVPEKNVVVGSGGGSKTIAVDKNVQKSVVKDDFLGNEVQTNANDFVVGMDDEEEEEANTEEPEIEDKDVESKKQPAGDDEADIGEQPKIDVEMNTAAPNSIGEEVVESTAVKEDKVEAEAIEAVANDADDEVVDTVEKVGPSLSLASKEDDDDVACQPSIENSQEGDKDDDDKDDEEEDEDPQLIVPSASNSDDSGSNTTRSSSPNDEGYVKIVRSPCGEAMSESEFLSSPLKEASEVQAAGLESSTEGEALVSFDEVMGQSSTPLQDAEVQEGETSEVEVLEKNDDLIGDATVDVISNEATTESKSKSGGSKPQQKNNNRNKGKKK